MTISAVTHTPCKLKYPVIGAIAQAEPSSVALEVEVSARGLVPSLELAPAVTPGRDSSRQSDCDRLLGQNVERYLGDAAISER